ncbi:MAG: hypothetical protein AAF927_26565 [Bacteroidota bacterium]
MKNTQAAKLATRVFCESLKVKFVLLNSTLDEAANMHHTDKNDSITARVYI